MPTKRRATIAPAKLCVNALSAVTKPHAKQMLASHTDGLDFSNIQKGNTLTGTGA
jgi:hypothetical protein